MDEKAKIEAWRREISEGKPYYILEEPYKFGASNNYQKIISDFKKKSAAHEGLVLLQVLFAEYPNIGHVENFLSTLAWKGIPVAAKFLDFQSEDKITDLVAFVIR